jgi:hypothetical protein
MLEKEAHFEERTGNSTFSATYRTKQWLMREEKKKNKQRGKGEDDVGTASALGSDGLSAARHIMLRRAWSDFSSAHKCERRGQMMDRVRRQEEGGERQQHGRDDDSSRPENGENSGGEGGCSRRQ